MKKRKKQTYCLVCRDYTKSINPKIVRNRQNRYIIQSNCATCGSKKSRFIKEQKALGILSNLGIKTPLSQVPLNKQVIRVIFIEMNLIKLVFNTILLMQIIKI